MVKGVARRVVVVKAPRGKEFEQAIFLLREDALDPEAPEEQVLRQAQEAAADYLRTATPRGRRRQRLLPLGFSLLGAAAASAAWFLTGLL